MTSTEEKIEQAFWEFDAERKRSGAERDAFKRQMRILAAEPIPMRLTCPTCGSLHIDEGEFATKPHHTHACQQCGNVWRPAVASTVGVRFLPGFKNEAPAPVETP